MPDLVHRITRQMLELGCAPSPEQSLLIAFSGGLDSTCLVHLLHGAGFRLGLAHVHYGLRPEADAQVQAMQALARDWGLPFHLLDAASDPALQDGNTQQVARSLRYDFFEELMAREGYAFCLTAHHMDDHAETILRSILRGRSQRLLKGIPAQRGPYLRPMLGIRRSELEAYAAEHALQWQEDSSNAGLDYDRNKLRHQVLPALRELNPSIEGQLVRLEDQYSWQQAALEASFRSVSDLFWDGSRLDLSRARQRFGAVGLRAYVLWQLCAAGLEERFAFEALGLLDAQVGARQLAGDHEVVRGRDALHVRKGVSERSERGPQELDSQDALPLTLEVGEGQAWRLYIEAVADSAALPFRAGTHQLALAAIRWPLRLRAWEQGDRMRPLGMAGSKKLSDVMIDEKWTPEQKSGAMVLEDAEGILCLLGYRIADRARRQPGPQALLVLESV